MRSAQRSDFHWLLGIILVGFLALLSGLGGALAHGFGWLWWWPIPRSKPNASGRPGSAPTKLAASAGRSGNASCPRARAAAGRPAERRGQELAVVVARQW